MTVYHMTSIAPDGEPLVRYVGMAGDSKARSDFADLPENCGNCTFLELATRMAEGGATTAYYADNVLGILQGTFGGPPELVTYNLGINDCPSLPTESDFKTDVLYIWDAIHNKWPAAQIWVMLIWGRNYDDECDTINGWLQDILPDRSFVHEGPDERIWMEGGDDGVTMTSDGIHPNETGQAEASHQWSVVFGCC